MQSPNNELSLYAITINKRWRKRTVRCSKCFALTVTTIFNNYKLQEEYVLNQIYRAGDNL